MKPQLLALIALAASSASYATSEISSTTIVDMAINRDYGNFVFIRVAQTPANPAACSTNGYWQYTLTLSNPGDHELYSMLLTAFSTGAAVDMSGRGVCNEWGTVESLRSLRVSK